MGKASRKKKQIQNNLLTNQSSNSSQNVSVRPFPIKMIYVFALICSCVLAYYNTLENEFVHDDKLEILENPYVHDIKYIKEAFTTSSWAWQSLNKNLDREEVSNYYRPTQALTYMFLYLTYGPNPKPFHIYKIILHILCVLLLFIVCQELFKQNTDKTFLACLIFALHPMHSEAVTWITGITDVNCTLFVLGSFLFFMKHIKSKKKFYFWLSGLFFFLGLLSKEIAIMIIPLFFIFEYLTQKKIPSRQELKKYIIYFILVGIYLGLRINAIGSFAPLEKYQYLTLFQVVLNAFPLMGKYFWKLLLPISFNAHYEFHPILSPFNLTFLISFFFVSAMIFSMWMFRRKNYIYILGLCWIIITLLPVMHCKKIGSNVFTERYLYLPSVGFSFIVSEFIFWLKTKKKRTIQIYSIFSCLIIFYYVQTVNRNITWKDNFIFWSNVVQVSPNDPLVRYNFGVLCENKGKIEMAMEQYKEAIRSNPFYAKAHNNLGSIYGRKKMFDLAIEEFKTALKIKPDYEGAHYNLGGTYMAKGLNKKAIKEFKEVLKINPVNGRTRRLLKSLLPRP